MNPLEQLIIDWIELIGWIANGVVVIQFLQKDMWKLRWWGIIGATLWGVYAVGIQSLPLFCLNLLIWLIQLYHLRKLSKEKKEKKSFGNDRKKF
jgi:uncharacterized membrane protein